MFLIGEWSYWIVLLLGGLGFDVSNCRPKADGTDAHVCVSTYRGPVRGRITR